MYIIVTKSSPNKQDRLAGDPIDLVVAHSSVGSFESSLDWLRNPASKVSSHYLISPVGDIVNLVDERKMAWHAGVSFWRGRSNINRYSIGIELANRGGMKGIPSEPYPKAQIDAFLWLVRDIARRRAIVLSRNTLVSHADIAPGRKHDPIVLDMDAVRARLGIGVVPVPALREMFIVSSRVNVRQGPGTAFPIAGQMYRGQRVLVDTTVSGERVGANGGQWVHLARTPPQQWDIGFISASLVR